MTENSNRWLDIEQLEEIYRIKKSSQALLRMRKQIPFSKINRMIRYSTDEIEKWLEDAKVTKGLNK